MQSEALVWQSYLRDFHQGNIFAYDRVRQQRSPMRRKNRHSPMQTRAPAPNVRRLRSISFFIDASTLSHRSGLYSRASGPNASLRRWTTNGDIATSVPAGKKWPHRTVPPAGTTRGKVQGTALCKRRASLRHAWKYSSLHASAYVIGHCKPSSSTAWVISSITLL